MVNNIIGTVGIGAASVQPDWNQNDPKAKDYVKNRTHYIDGEIINITWDGKTDGLTHIDVDGVTIYKVSDKILTNEEIQKGVITFSDGTSEVVANLDVTNYEGAVVIDSNRFGTTVAILKKPIVMNPGDPPVKTGTYYAYDIDTGDYVSTFTSDIRTFSKLDPRYIPDRVLNAVHKAEEASEALTNYGIPLYKYSKGRELRDTDLDEHLLYGHYYIAGEENIPSGNILRLYRNVENSKYTTYATVLNHDYIESFYVDDDTFLSNRTIIFRIGKDGIIIGSSTPNSTKKFKITVDDTGAISATEVTRRKIKMEG